MDVIINLYMLSFFLVYITRRKKIKHINAMFMFIDFLPLFLRAVWLLVLHLCFVIIICMLCCV